jgi:hypothetical protein
MDQIQNDPPVEEVRELRRRISARFDHDPDQWVAYYLRLQEQYKDRLIDTAKKKDTDEHAA